MERSAPQLLDDMTPTELQLSACLLLARADKLPKGHPQLPRLLMAAHALLERSRVAVENIEAEWAERF